MGDERSSGSADDDDDMASSGFLRVVWFRQMIHRWQSSSSGATARSSSATGDGERANDHDASTDRTTNDAATPAAAAVHNGSERDPLLPASAAADRRPLLLPRVVEERRCPDEGCGCGDSPMTPMTPDAPAGVPRGCCPVYVGSERRRFVVPTAYLGMPVFRRLLEKAEEEFEFHYGGGGVTIPCDTEAFKYILLVMERHRQGLVDDEGNAKEEDRGGEEQQGGSSSSTEAQDQATMTTISAADGGVIGEKDIIVHGA